MRHCDHVVAETECEQHLGGGWDKADDSHQWCLRDSGRREPEEAEGTFTDRGETWQSC
jgi:hypothetical protein